MSIQFMDPLDVKACREKAEEHIKYARTVARAYELVRPVFVKHNGKKMTKRMETDFVKALDEAGIEHEHMWCRFDRQYRMFHFKIGGTWLGMDFNNKVSFNVHLGYESQGDIMSVQFADEHNPYYAKNAVVEAEENEANLAIIAGLVQQWNGALKIMQSIHKQAEAVGLQYTFDIGK